MAEPMADAHKQLSGKKALGILGGTFDPVHYGHLRIAEEARDQRNLERVLLVPNQVSPFKVGETQTDGHLRATMVSLAIDDHPAFSLWDGELSRPGPSYTVDTLRALSEAFPDYELVFVTGTDAVLDLPKWREPEVVIALARFIAFIRPGVPEDAVRAALPAEWLERIEFLTMTGLDIASTAIRSRVREGRSIRYLLPTRVEQFIRTHRLYQDENPDGDGISGV